MEVVVLYVEGCPNRGLAESRVQIAAERLGLKVEVSSRQVDSAAQATALGFRGSPTLVVDGVDPFPGQQDLASLVCRLYRTKAGLEGAPSVSDLEEVLSRRERSSARS
jgi:hypothetical protein